MRRTLLALAEATASGALLVGCGGTDDEASACTPGPKLTVAAAGGLDFDADSYEAAAGCVEITFTNDSGQAHTLLVKGKSGFKLSVGSTDTGTLDLAAGSYELYCDVAGHEAGGMVANLEVT